jgi:hypothetical protein
VSRIGGKIPAGTGIANTSNYQQLIQVLEWPIPNCDLHTICTI